MYFKMQNFTKRHFKAKLNIFWFKKSYTCLFCLFMFNNLSRIEIKLNVFMR